VAKILVNIMLDSLVASFCIFLIFVMGFTLPMKEEGNKFSTPREKSNRKIPDSKNARFLV
jgi:hypothetical protein